VKLSKTRKTCPLMHESMSARTFLQLQARAAGPDILVGSWIGKNPGFSGKSPTNLVFFFFFFFFGFIFFKFRDVIGFFGDFRF